MRSLLSKELRPILLPAASVLAVVMAGLVLSALEPPLDIQFGIYMLGCAYLAAIPFGMEFHQRTFSLLLSQPVPRAVVWGRKTAIILSAAAALAVLCYWTWPRTRFDEKGEVLISMALTACSACFWTLLARSVIGGAVFTIAGQVLIALGVNFVQAIVARVFGPASATSAVVDDHAMAVAIPLSCAAFLWLGWVQFRRFEVTEAGALRSSGRAGGSSARYHVPWLRAVRGAPLMNLIRKELLLYRPVFAAAALFTICWLAAVLVRWIAPQRVTAEFFVIIGVAVTIITALLGGSLSIAEERSLGTADWQRSLPFPSERQWNLKVLVVFLVAVLFGVMLPFLLTSLAIDFGGPGAKANTAGQLLLGMLLSGAALLAIAVWASALTTSAVRSAALATLMAVLLLLLFVLASYVANETSIGHKLETTLALLLFPLAAELQLDSRELQSYAAKPVWGAMALGLVCCLALAQAWRQYREPQRAGSGLRRLIALVTIPPLGTAPATFLASTALASAGFVIWLIYFSCMNATSYLHSSGLLSQ